MLNIKNFEDDISIEFLKDFPVELHVSSSELSQICQYFNSNSFKTSNQRINIEGTKNIKTNYAVDITPPDATKIISIVQSYLQTTKREFCEEDFRDHETGDGEYRFTIKGSTVYKN